MTRQHNAISAYLAAHVRYKRVLDRLDVASKAMRPCWERAAEHAGSEEHRLWQEAREACPHARELMSAAEIERSDRDYYAELRADARREERR